MKRRRPAFCFFPRFSPVSISGLAQQLKHHERRGAKPQTPVKRRSRDDVTFGADGRARKRRQIVISDDDESEFDEFDEEKDDVKREYVRMLRAAREDIKERGQWDPIDEAIKAAQARVTGDDRRDDDRLRRIRGAMWLKVRTSELASRVGTCVEIKVRQPNSLVDSTQVAAHPDATLKVALACLDASPEAAAVLIVALAADEDLNRFWPSLSQWEAWVKSKEMGREWTPSIEMQRVSRGFRQFFSSAGTFGIRPRSVQFLINCCAWANSDC